MLKTRVDTFGNNFGHFWIFEVFLIFWKYFEDSTLHGTLGKKKFPKKVPQNMFKTLLDNLGTFLGVFGVLKLFWFLKTFRWLDTPWNTWQKFFSKKLPQNLFKTCLDNLGTNLGVFAILKLFKFFQKPFEDSTFHGTLGRKNFSEKLPQDMFKTRLDTFGNDSGHFWNFENFLIFWNHFEDSTLHGTLRKEKFPEKVPQNMFKTLLDNLGTTLGVFGIWKIFWIYIKTFHRLDPPWNTGQKMFSQNLPQNMIKTLLDNLGTILRAFGILKIFLKHFEDSTLHGKLGKRVFEKFTPKHNQNKFRHFWERFWAFLEFWNCFDFLKTFRRLDPQWNTGQKNVSKKLPQNMFKILLDNLGTILGVFGFLKTF